MSKTLVLGATGKTGRRVAERLQQKGVDVRLGSRNAAIPFHWDLPVTWPAVLQDVDQVYITYQPDLAVPAAVEDIRQFVAEAKRANVKKLVLLSGRGEKEAEHCEQIVVDSGLEFTILQSSWFMQNFSEHFFAEGIAQGKLVLPQVTAREPFVDLDDLADAASICLTSNIHSGKTYALTGPQLLSFEEAVGIIANATWQNIQFEAVPIQAYIEALSGAGVPADVTWLIEYLFTEVLDGRNEFTTPDLQLILGRESKTFEQYVLANIKAWAFNNAMA